MAEIQIGLCIKDDDRRSIGRAVRLFIANATMHSSTEPPNALCLLRSRDEMRLCLDEMGKSHQASAVYW